MSRLTLRTRRTQRTIVERLLGWDRAYETEAAKGLSSVTARGKTEEASQKIALRSWRERFGADCSVDA
jgi:hypothetical protein